jgi:hypothetical protein
MENKLILGIQKEHKKIQKTLTTTDSKLKKLERLTKALGYRKVNDLLNALIDEYLDKGELSDEKKEYKVSLKEILDTNINNPKELQEYIKNKGIKVNGN